MDAKMLRALAEDWPAPYVLRTVPVAAPGSPAEVVLTAPGESTWAVLALTATLTTAAPVAARAAVLTVTDGSTVLWRIAPGATQAASLTTTYSWVAEYPAFPTAVVGNALVVPMPPTYLAPGWTLTTATANVQAGDAWTGIVATVVECFTGHVERERALADSFRDEADALAGVIERGY